MKKKFVNTFTEKQMQDAAWFYMRRQFRFLQMGALLTGFLCIMLVWNFLDGTLYDTSTLVLIIIYAILMVALIAIIVFVTNTALKDIKRVDGATYIVTETGIERELSSKKIERKPLELDAITWQQVRAVRENEAALFVFLVRQQYFVLNKVALAEAADYIKEKVKEVQHG